jgi:hypothetical protein
MFPIRKAHELLGGIDRNMNGGAGSDETPNYCAAKCAGASGDDGLTAR